MTAALIVRPFQFADLQAVPVPPAVPFPSYLHRLRWRGRIEGEVALTAVSAAGRIIACAGTQHMRAGFVRAWAFFAFDAGPHLLRLWRLQCAALDRCAGCLVLAWVNRMWRPSVRWARLLGFAPSDKQVQIGGQLLTLYGRSPDASLRRCGR